MKRLRICASSRFYFLHQEAAECVFLLGISNSNSLVIKNTDYLAVFDNNKFPVVLFDQFRLMSKKPVELFFELTFHRIGEYVSL